MADAADRVAKQVEQWRNDLVDLTRRNRLLNVRPGTRSSDLLVVEPGAEEILARLLGGSGRQAEWRFHYPPLDPEILADPLLAAALESEDTELTPEREPDELLTELSSARTLSAKLHTLERKAGQEFLDKGLRVLYLGVGMLQWTDLDATPMQSPLVMVPVTLSRRSPRDPYRLAGTEDDLALNPALAVKLETDFGVELPGLDDPANALAVLDTVARSVGGQTGWRVTRGAVLGAFSFHKESMYRDLEHNHATVVAHVLVRALSGEQVDPGALDLAPVADADLDETVPPEPMASILDADSTQRRCIAAARDGRSFVMDGPPGTGKSQTIANMISELLVAGKTVLFVSEKAAALEVVKNRLDRAGLGSFMLELHSHKATRKELAKALGVALGERVRATSELADADLARAERLRRELSAYAIAQNEVRDHLGISLHTAIGRRAVLDAELAAPVPTTIDTAFTAADHEAITALAERLAGAWGPVSGGASFLWRDLADPAGAQQRLTAMGIDLGAALDTLGSLRGIAGAVAAQLRLPPPADDAAAERLAAIVALLGSRPTASTSWLTVADPAPLLARVDELETMIGAHRAAVAYLDSWGGTWQGLEPGHELILDQRVEALRSGPAPIELVPVTPAASVRSTADYLEWLVAEAPALLAAADPLADQLGLERRRVPAELAMLASIGRCAAAPARPDAAWFADPALTAARAAVAALQPVIEQNRSIESDLAAVFTPAVYQLDIESFYDSPQDLVPQLGRLRGEGRANRRQLKACVPNGDLTDEVVVALPLVRRWHQTQAQLVAAETTHAAALGSWYHRADTDFAAIDAALDLATQIIALLGGDPVPARLIDQLRAEGPVAERLVTDADALAARVDQWTRSLVNRPHLPGPTLSGWAVDDVTRWAADSLPAVRALGAELDTIHAVAARELTVDTARQFAAGRTTIATTDAAVAASAAHDAVHLGSAYAGVDTDTAAVRRGLAWCTSVRALLPTPIPEPVAATIVSVAIPPGELDRALGSWRVTTGAILAWFQPGHAAELEADLASGFDDAATLLIDLRATTAQVDEWVAHAGAVAGLTARGLGPTVEHLLTAGSAGADVAEHQVAPAIERAVLSAWIDAVLAGDARCQPIRSGERDQLVAEYRALDRELVRHAAARVMKAGNARRPSTAVGEASIIRREAEKKTRHRPIRTLLAEAGRVSQQLKPCFMMSPLSVSQFLPPDLTFDVVIFDEASQVRPGDAIGSIYRGRQLIVAGDNRQLPPTSFFDRIGDVDDTYDSDALDLFDSVLDLCRSAAQVPDLPLRWHYRSRHESLITFSNREFYGGSLITYPGAVTDGDDLGVVFRHVPNGVYERGGARDNPIEAATVVERVLWFAEHHPDLSVGVVAFSEAQATRIGWEIEAARRQRPDLDAWFQEDRLDGFFVKNLENVQGDERDIILFSVGYGFDEAGKLTMNFGPLNQEGGHRRLNVAITRARRRVEVISSITAADIRDTPSAGVGHFKRYLDYAERGAEALVAIDGDDAGEPESPFEVSVRDTIAGWGHEVVSQVGHAGYRIDLGIRHPEHPGTYLLGIECDGAAYHSSAVARDRDRLRQDVLEGLGWTLHRVWGPSWYRDRPGEEARLRRAIAAALALPTADDGDGGEDGDGASAVAAPAEGPGSAQTATTAVGSPDGADAPGAASPGADGVEAAIDVEIEHIDLDGPPGWVVPYAPATLAVRVGHVGVDDLRSRADLLVDLVAVVDIEGPVHRGRCADALREPWGITRMTARTRAAIDQALDTLVAQGTFVVLDESFVARPHQPSTLVRGAIDGDDRSVRHPGEVPPGELQAALEQLVADSHTIAEDDLTTQVARLFGWPRRTPDVIAALGQALADLEATGRVGRDVTGRLAPPPRSPPSPSPPSPT